MKQNQSRILIHLNHILQFPSKDAFAKSAIFNTGLEIAKYLPLNAIQEMEDYDNNWLKILQSLGCWHGFIGQLYHFNTKNLSKTNEKRVIYIYLDG